MKASGQVGKFVNTALTAEVLATGDGALTNFTGTLLRPPIVKSSLSVFYTIGGTAYTGTDDGAGAITGTNITSGTINYLTGAYDITFSTAPDNTTDITADYTARGLLDVVLEHITGAVTTAEVLATGNGTLTNFTGNFANTPVARRRISISYTIGSTVYAGVDDGAGAITGTNISSGTITYSTGAYDITFSTAPDNATNITADYISGAMGAQWKVELDQDTEDNAGGTPFSSDCMEVILSSTGNSGQENVIVGIREWRYPAGNAWGWDLNGYLDYTPATKWNSNSGDHGFTAYDGTWEHFNNHPMLPLFDDTMYYWLYSNNQKITLVVKVASYYESMYLGFGKRLANPSDYPYPLLVIGSLGNNKTHTDTSGHHKFIAGPNVISISGVYSYSYWVVTPANLYKWATGASFYPYQTFNQYNSGLLHKTDDNNIAIMPVMIKASGDTLMEMDGVFHTPYNGIQSEDTITIGSDVYRVFMNIYRNDYWEYMAIFEE